MISNKRQNQTSSVAATQIARLVMLVSFSALATIGLLLALHLLRASAY